MRAENDTQPHGGESVLLRENLPLLAFLKHCGEQLAGVLAGRADPRQVLFPDGSFEAVGQVYRDTSQSRYYNGIMAAVVARLVAALPVDRRLRLVEIGAGTGGTTSALLPVLPAERTEYLFSDVSPLFLHRAQERFRDFRFVTYQTLDVAEDIESQGLGRHEYDVVVAANVLHATADLGRSLEQVRALLAPHGLLLLREITRSSSVLGFEVTFGPLLGELRDEQLRHGHPFLSPAGWRHTLEAGGFERVAVLPEDPEEHFDEHVVIARASPAAAGAGAFCRLHHAPPAAPIGDRTDRPEHPLLGSRLSSPLAEAQFQGRLSVARQPYLGEHRVFDLVVVPGTAHFEIAVAAGMSYFGDERVVLEQMSLREALILPEEEERLLQVVLSPQGDGAVAFKTFSTTAGEDGRDDWHLHALGSLRPDHGRAAPPAAEDLAAWRRRCRQEVDVSSYYQGFASYGTVQYGPTFRGIRRLWRHRGEALGEVVLEPSLRATRSRYHIHPALLDSCLQTMVAAAISAESELAGGDGFMPFSVDAVRFFKQAPETVWCHARMPAGDSFKQELFTIDLSITDPDGGLVATISGLHMKRTSRQALERLKAAQERLADYLYEMRWQPAAEIADDQPVAAPGCWLVLADRGEVAAGLAAELERAGHRCRLVRAGGQAEAAGATIEPLAADAFDELLRTWAEESVLRPAGIIHLRGLDDPLGEDDEAATVRAVLERTVGSLLHLVQALARRRWDEPPRLCVVTRGGQCTRDGETPALAAGALGGMSKVIGNEHPELRPLIVDLDAARDESAVTLLCRCLLADGAEEQLALRAGAVLVPRLIPGSLPDGERRPGLTLPGDAAAYRLDSPQSGIDNLCLVPHERRRPGSGEIEIEVHATGLNFRDVMLAMGINPAKTSVLGTDCAGVVTAVGPEVSGVAAGDRVVATAYGSFASHVTTPAATAAVMAEEWSFAEAATIPTAFMTAWHALHEVGGLSAGQRLLIHSAAGGVGLAAVQVAQAAGAQIFATAGSERKRALLRSLGIGHVFHSRTLEFADQVLAVTDGEGVDLVLNFLTGDFVDRGLQILAAGGRFLEIGKTDIRSPEAVAGLRSDVSYHVIDLERMGYEQGERLRGIFDAVMAGFADGRYRPLPLRIFAVRQVAQAFHYMVEARHVGKVVVVQACERPVADRSIRSEAGYLITGGLGGLGLVLAGNLVEQGARHLVLVGRRPPTDEAEGMLAELRERGAAVEVAAVDVTDRAALEQLLDGVAQRLPPLAGVFHLAGVLDDDPLLQLDWPRFAGVLAPKVEGAWHLHQLTRHLPLDHFVLFSSMASVFGTHGQANHVVANSFLDALALSRRADLLPALSINWGAWGGVGTVAQLGIEERIRAQGVETFEPQVGLAILEKLLAGDSAQVAVLAIDWSKLLPSLTAGGRGKLFAEIAARRPQPPVPQESAPDDELLRQLRRLPLAERSARLRLYLKREIAQFLRVGEQTIPDDEDLIQLGMDSLISLDLFQRISRDLHIRIAPHEISAKPTVAAMAERFARDVGPAEESADRAAPPVSPDAAVEDALAAVRVVANPGSLPAVSPLRHAAGLLDRAQLGHGAERRRLPLLPGGGFPGAGPGSLPAGVERADPAPRHAAGRHPQRRHAAGPGRGAFVHDRAARSARSPGGGAGAAAG